MKVSELRQIIKEEVSKALNEATLVDIPNNHPLKKDVESVFGTTFEPYCFKFDKKEDLVGININYLSDDTGIDPNKVTSLVRGMSGMWPEKYEKAYPSLEELDPDYYMVVKLRP